MHAVPGVHSKVYNSPHQPNFAGSAGKGPHKRQAEPCPRQEHTQLSRAVSPPATEQPEQAQQACDQQRQAQRHQLMLTDTPNQGKDGVRLAGAYQGVGASPPASATQGTDGVQTNAQGRAAFNSAQQARKVADALVQNIAAADDATDAAEEEVAKWDATISDLIEKLNAAHEKRAAASRTSQDSLARRQVLEVHLQDMTANTSNVLEILQSTKRRKFDGVDL